MAHPDLEPRRAGKPVVSVIVEGYNETRDLGTAADTIAALREQDFPLDQVEVILMGNAAQTLDWNRRHGGSTPFWGMRAIDAEGLSYLGLKNHGAGFAAAEILAFTDSDVHPHRTWLSSLVAGIRDGADVSIGLSLFNRAGSWEWNHATRLATASISWGWVVGREADPERALPRPAGFMDHNFGIRAETFRRYQYRAEHGRLLGAPLLMRAFLDGGARLYLQPGQRVTHQFSWRHWARSLHFRWGYEVFKLRRLDRKYPNQWIARTGALEPFITMGWHILLDIPRWFRVARLLDIHPLRRLLLFPLVILLSTVARGAEAAGMICTMRSPESMRRWAESV